MLQCAVENVQTGRADLAFLVRVQSTWEISDIVILASIIERVRRVRPA